MVCLIYRYRGLAVLVRSYGRRIPSDPGRARRSIKFASAGQGCYLYAHPVSTLMAFSNRGTPSCFKR